MSLQIDEILDRRRLSRKLTFWRVLSFLIVALAILATFFFLSSGKNWFSKTGDHIAKVEIKGVITNDSALLDMLEEIEKADEVKGVLLIMDSPGGTVVGGETIYEALRAVAVKKPVATSVGTLAASAGYMIASASDHIVSHRSSIVGSIGVLFQYPTIGGLLDKIGVRYETIKSAPLKAEPSIFHDTTPEVKAVIEELVEDNFNWFVDLVAERRPFDRETALKLATGRVYTGAQGLENKLIDAIGDEDTALKWLIETKKLDKDLPIVKWKKPEKQKPLAGLLGLAPKISQIFGLDLNRSHVEQLRNELPQQLLQNGLLAIWQPSR